MRRTKHPNLILRGLLKYHNDPGRIIIGGDAIEGDRPAFRALVNQHQLAWCIQPILVPAMFHRQPDWLHLSLARGQPVTGSIQIEMARPQAIGAMVAVVDAREDVRARYQYMTVRALEISKG